MMKRISILLFALMFALAAQAQTDAAVKRIADRSAAVETLTCDFEQTKRVALMESEARANGKLYYRKGGSLRWEYIAPTPYSLTMSGDKVVLRNATGQRVLDAKSNRMLRMLSRMIVGSVDGSIYASGDFRTSVSVEQGRTVLTLTPVAKQVAAIYRDIVLRFAANDYLEQIAMTELSGDCTTIRILRPKVNEPIDETLFSIE